MNMLPRDFGIDVDAEGSLITTSRAVAERFGKEHRHILRDIEEIIAKTGSPILGTSLYRRTDYVNDIGQSQPSYILSRTGFMLLVMGYTGIEHFQIKLAYAQAFDAMELQLRGQWKDGVHWREARERLDLLIKGQNGLAIVCEKISDDTGEVRRMSRNQRRIISPKVRSQHIDAINRLGGRCPCCGRIEIVKDGVKIVGLSDFDHYRSNQIADITATWLICLKCHGNITAAKLLRDETDPLFTAYQMQRRNLPDPQIVMSFFGDLPRINRKQRTL